MKKFIITENTPAILVNVYEVKADNETDALHQVLNGDIEVKYQTFKNIDTNKTEYDVEEVIKIVYYSEVIDNWGRKEASFKGDVIFSVLNNVENWNDDMIFEDENRHVYSIDELMGKHVLVEGIGVFTVPRGEN